MKVTFVYPDFFQYADGTFMPEGRIYLGIAYLSAVLKQAGHETSLVHVVEPPGARVARRAGQARGARPGRFLQHHSHVQARRSMGRVAARGDGHPDGMRRGPPDHRPRRGASTRPASTIACRGRGRGHPARAVRGPRGRARSTRIPGLWARTATDVFIATPSAPLSDRPRLAAVPGPLASSTPRCSAPTSTRAGP